MPVWIGHAADDIAWREEFRLTARGMAGNVTFKMYCRWWSVMGSMNKNMIKDSLIGTATLDLNQVAAVGGYMDTNLPVISDGQHRGFLHIVIRWEDGNLACYS